MDREPDVFMSNQGSDEEEAASNPGVATRSSGSGRKSANISWLGLLVQLKRLSLSLSMVSELEAVF